MIAAVGVPATGLQTTRETISTRKSANAVSRLENFILGRRVELGLLR